MSSNLITDAQTVTRDWLTDVLQSNGHLSQGSITSFTKSVSQPFGATTVRIHVSYNHAASSHLPTAFLLKIDGPDSPAGEREVRFYTEYAASHPAGITIPCFDAVYANEQQAYHLLMPDLSASHYTLEPEAPPTLREATRMIDTLAVLHAAWWNKLPSNIDFVDAALLSDHPFRFDEFINFMGERLTNTRRKRYERILMRLPILLRERMQRGGQTLAHDDAHAWNFMQPRHEQHELAILIDWQQWGRSIGAHDVAYLITLFWYPDHRRLHELNMVKRYHARLLAHGVSKYSWEECWEDYRLYTLRNMLVPLWAWQMGHWRPHRWMQIEKSMFAYEELSCEDLLH